jgi:hypothetical protein
MRVGQAYSFAIVQAVDLAPGRNAFTAFEGHVMQKRRGHGGGKFI